MVWYSLPTMQKSSWLPPGRRQKLLGVVLALVVVVLFLPGLTGSKMLCFRDNLADQLGWRLRAASELARGQLPFIDPTIDAGVPMLADPNTMTLYPTTWLFIILPPATALAAHDGLHLMLLALGAYVLLRRRGHAKRPALAGATFAAGAGIACSQLAFTNSIATLAWTPWLIATAVRVPRDTAGAWRRVASAAMFGALTWYAGEPVIAAAGWLTWLLALLFERHHPPLKSLVRFGAAPILSAALAAPLLIPFASIYPTSHRAILGLPPGSIGADAFRPARWPELLLPHLYGAPGSFAPDGFWAAPSFPWIRYEVNLHVGTIALALLLLGAWRRETRWWTVLLGVATFLAAAPGVFEAAKRLIWPLGSFRYAIKLLLLGFLAAIPIIARGVAVARKRRSAFRRISAVLAIVTLVLATPLLTPRSTRTTLSALYPASAANLARPGVAASISRSVRKDVIDQLLPLAAAAIAPRVFLIPSLAVQLILEGRSMLIWDTWTTYSTPSPVMKALEHGPRTLESIMTPVGRLRAKPVPSLSSPVAQSRFQFSQAFRFDGAPYGIRYRGCLGPDGLEPWWSADAALRLAGTQLPFVAHAARHLGIDTILRRLPLPPSKDMTASRTLSAGGAPVTINRLARPAPAAWMAVRDIQVPSRSAAWRQLEDPSSIPGSDAVTFGRHSGVTLYRRGSVHLLQRTPSRWRIRTHTPGPGLLVLDQAFAPQWKIRIDGRPGAATLVNLCRLGIRLPSGTHTVTIIWSRTPLRTGLGTAGAAMLIILAMFYLPRRRPSHRSPTDDPAPRHRATRREPSL